MAYYSHHFETQIERHDLGRYAYTVVYLPEALARELPFDQHPRLRTEADVAGLTVRGAWQPGQGRHYLMLARPALKTAGLAVGDRVEVAFRLLPQDQVDLPPELAALLAAEPDLAAAWQALTAGQQRGLAQHLGAAKRADTRAARLAQVRAMLLGLQPLPWQQRNSRQRVR